MQFFVLLFPTFVCLCLGNWLTSQSRWIPPEGVVMNASKPRAPPLLVWSRRPPSVSEMQQWIQKFRAKDPEFQQFCVEKLTGSYTGPMGAQYGQDMMLFFNLFLTKTLRGETGFYVDSGANHWAELSTSLFYDKCLGWHGLCVEPLKEYQEGLRARRSCRVMQECLADVEALMPMEVNGYSSKVLPLGSVGHMVSCRPLAAMLAEIGADHVDFWSLDVEGFEMTALRSGVPFGIIDAIVVENFWLSTRSSDRFLTDRGFAKISQMNVDGLFVRMSTLWYPDNWMRMWNDMWLEEKKRDSRRLEELLGKANDFKG